MRDDKYFMKMALALAGKGRGKTSPNPMVGAVIVKGGRVLGKGYHKMAGLEHAEIAALRDAGARTAGATLYVTLEPCDHFGRTPPCTNAIIKSGIGTVVAAMKDPNPLNNGKGFARLKAAGLKVVEGVLKDDAMRLNEVFVKYITTGLPYVTVKVAQSIDGKIATKTGDSKWISGEQSRRFVHKMRGWVDAIMVGAGTIIADNPLLTSRVANRLKGRQPIKIIVDAGLNISPKARIFGSSSPAKVIIAASKNAPDNRANRFRTAGADVLKLKDKKGIINLIELFRELGKKEITSILVEGGGTLIGNLRDAGLIDKILFFVSPRIIGGKSAVSSVAGEGVSRISESLKLNDVRYKRFGDDLLVEGRTPCSQG